MLYPYRILSPGRPVVLVRLSGPFDLERSVSTLGALEFLPWEGEWRGLLWDVRKRTGYPDAAEVRELVGYFGRWNRTAIVADRDVQYGMGRMASLLAEGVMAVRTLREGMRWATGEE